MIRWPFGPPRASTVTEIPSPTVPPVVETEAGLGRHGVAHPASFYGRTDRFGDDDHGGSADLDVWPPNFPEIYWSDWTLQGDELAAVRLRDVALTDTRTAALLRDARRRRDAETLLGRIG